MGTEVPLDRTKLKTLARNLRTRGWPYSRITAKLSVPKSTLNHWFRGLPPSPHQSPQAYMLRLKKIHGLGAQANKRLREARLALIEQEVIRELEHYPRKDVTVLRSLLSMLYWAEGNKSSRHGIIFANTDPKMVLLFLTLFRRCYVIDENRLHVRLHLHHYHNAREAINFWSTLLKVPAKQFGKIYWKKRSETKRFRPNFQGICFVQYTDGALKHRILTTGYTLQKVLTLPS